MKFKIFISSLILFFSFFASNLHAKLLPPGTGTQADVPSNLLILLDKSGSMGWRMSNAQSINRMMDGVTDSSGNIYIAQFARYGVRKIDYTTGKTDTSWGSNGRVVELTILTMQMFITGSCMWQVYMIIELERLDFQMVLV